MSKQETVLVVEDSDDLRYLYRLALGFAGYRVIDAADGLEALALLEANRPDLVVLDLNLPRVSGYAVRHELAASAVTRDIPIVVVTGSLVSAEALAVSCLLRKPFTPDSLVDAVRRSLT